MIDAATMTRADMTVKVCVSDAHAWLARADALITAIGLWISSPLPTTQSSAFFTTPGTPWAYSGLDIQDRIARLQPGPKPGDRLRCALAFEKSN